MKSSIHSLLVTCVLLLTAKTVLYSQTPGKYQSVDGRYSISIGVTADGSIEVKEPNKTSLYTKSGNYFRHSDPKYSAFLIRVGNDKTIYTLKEGTNGEYQFNWISNEEISSGGCALYDKYLAKATEAEGDEVQAWTFCAAAAKAKCNSSVDAFRDQAAGIVTTLKLIIVDKDNCPCPEVIPTDIWRNN